jgi:hypothetical protein
VKQCIFVYAVATLMLASYTAAGQEAESEADAEQDDSSKLDEPGEPDRSYSHFMQFGLRASLVGGYRMVFRYDDSPLCNEDDVGERREDRQKFCGFGGPLAVDLGLSFAVLGPIEPYLWGRFGLTGEANTNTEPVRILGVGTRIYTTSASAFKVYIEPAVAYEFEGGAGHPGYQEFEYKKDLVLHLGVGPQIDVSRGVGLFLNGGMTTGILRAIHASLELQGGVQVRVP